MHWLRGSRRDWRFMATLVLSLTAAACGARSKPTIRIAVSGQGNLSYLPATLAMQLKLYEAEGLNVVFINLPGGGAKSLEALFGGSADVVCGFFDLVIQMNAEGRRLKAFVTMARFPELALVSSPKTQRQIDSIASLKGTAIGISSPGSSTDLIVRHILLQNGIRPEDVSLIGIGSGARAVAAMERGMVDAAMMGEPSISILEKRAGPLHILADTRTSDGLMQTLGVDHYPTAVLFSTEDWIANHTESAAFLAHALEKALHYLQSSPREAASRMPGEFQGDDPALYSAVVQHSLSMYSPDGKMPNDGPEIVRKVLSMSMEKVRRSTFNLQASFTNQWPHP